MIGTEISVRDIFCSFGVESAFGDVATESYFSDKDAFFAKVVVFVLADDSGCDCEIEAIIDKCGFSWDIEIDIVFVELEFAIFGEDGDDHIDSFAVSSDAGALWVFVVAGSEERLDFYQDRAAIVECDAQDASCCMCREDTL